MPSKTGWSPAIRPPVAAEAMSVTAGSVAPAAPRADPPGPERFTEARVERIIRLVVALGCAVLGAQSFLNAIGSTQEDAAWHIALMVGAFAPLALMILALVTGVWARAASGACAVALLVVFACWPLATRGIASSPHEQPWIWYLINVACAAAVVAFSLPVQIAWATIAPLAYAVVRLAQVGTADEEMISVVLDTVFAMILAGLIIALAWLLRSMGRSVDQARGAAVESYAAAAAADAAESERIAVAALMHDSVLAALIAAERATTPREEALAVAMAREALTRLANAEQDAREGSDETVPAASLAGDIERAAAETGLELQVASHVSDDAPPVPGRVARAVVLAASQALANAAQHATGRGVTVTLAADARALAVRVADAGTGFVPAEVAHDRLGIRGSIVARMAAAGGRGRVQTGRTGTTVLLDWEYPS